MACVGHIYIALRELNSKSTDHSFGQRIFRRKKYYLVETRRKWMWKISINIIEFVFSLLKSVAC